MEFDIQIDSENDNVVSLDEQRKLRQQRDAEEQVEMVAAPVCEGGVCSLNWSPKKKTAAA